MLKISTHWCLLLQDWGNFACIERSLKSLSVIVLFMSVNRNGSVLTIFTFKVKFTFKVQRRRGFQIALDYSLKLFGHMFLIGTKLTRLKKLVVFVHQVNGEWLI